MVDGNVFIGEIEVSADANQEVEIVFNIDANSYLAVNGVVLGEAPFGASQPPAMGTTVSWLEAHLSQAEQSLASDQARRSQILGEIGMTEADFLSGTFGRATETDLLSEISEID